MQFVVFLAATHACLVGPDTAVSSASEHIKIPDVSNGLLKFIPPLLSIRLKYNIVILISLNSWNLNGSTCFYDELWQIFSFN